ncbi:MAG: sugar phosphate nucleotidyltransferase [Pseudomonadota bacterium]
MTNKMIGIIPAAGSGVRARPYSYEIHKGLFAIDGKPNLARNITIMKEDLGIEEVVIITGYMADEVMETLGDGSDMGVKIHYEHNQHLDRGWAWSVLLAKPYLAGRHACVMLSDEFYLDTNIADITTSGFADHTVTVAVKTGADEEAIKRNFSVERNGARIVRLVENPVSVQNDILGMATFIAAPVVLDKLAEAYDGGRPSVEFVNFVDELIRDGHSVSAFDMTGEYINLNDVSSLEDANDLAIRARLIAEEG